MVIKINIFGLDAIIGDFQLSNYGLVLASFESSHSSKEELGMENDTVEEYVGHNPVPIYLGSSFHSKLHLTAALIKDPNTIHSDKNKYFTEHECREILRQLTGFYGYKQMQVFSYEFDELLFFHIRVANVKYQKAGGRIAGIVLEMECDSPFAWSSEFHYTFHASPSSSLILFNSSDNLYDYLLPKVTITADAAISHLSICNLSDNNWTTTLQSLSAGEIITMDSQRSLLSSSHPSRIINNDFNMHFIRLVPGKNEFQVSHGIQIAFTYRVPRKVGFIL